MIKEYASIPPIRCIEMNMSLSMILMYIVMRGGDAILNDLFP